jgi:hypothetical protein
MCPILLFEAALEFLFIDFFSSFFIFVKIYISIFIDFLIDKYLRGFVRNLSRKNLIGCIGVGILTFMLPLGIKVYAEEQIHTPESSYEDTWVAKYYPNKTLKGKPIVEGGKNSAVKLRNINFNWKSGSPHPSIPADGFPARFTKSLEFEDGTYEFQIRADDRSRLWVDDQLVIDSWVSTSGI